MAFKIIFFVAALVACVQARPGGPAAYSIVAPAGDHQSVGNTHEHTVKGPGGASSQSEYSSQVQTAHSQSHVSRSSISNDGLAPAHVVAHAPAHGYAPAPLLAHHGYAGYAHAAPALSYAHAEPLYSHGYGHGYGYSGYEHEHASGPAYYGHEPVSHSYVATAPVVAPAPAYAAHHYAAHALPAYPAYPALPALHAPVVKAIAAPALVHTAVHGHGVHYGY